ncbi:MAG: hypothetical protein ABI718_12965 [Acidobacteriota bacterium]
MNIASQGDPRPTSNLRTWLESVARTGPAPLSRSQLLAMWWTAALIVPTRIFARSASIWDWDESLFILGIRGFDVGAHHPHPPGFPLYMILGKLFDSVLHSEQLALQSINIIAAALLFPVLFYFARELRFSFFPAFAGSLITVFLPNVWFYGGTALSDVPALTMIVGAIALMLAGVRRPGAGYSIVGCFLYGASTGLRAQNLLIGLAGFAAATYLGSRTNRLRALSGFLIAGVTAASLTIGAAVSTGWSRYWWVVKQHRIYIVSHDSFLAPGRQQLTSIMELFFVREPGAGPLSWILFLLLIAGIVHAVRSRSASTAFLAATFVPFAAFAWLMLDMWSAHRFSIGYIPLVAFIAAEGISLLTALVSPRVHSVAAWSVTGTLICALIVWTVPALRVARSSMAPQTSAAIWIRNNFPAERWSIVETHGMAPFVAALLPEYRSSEVEDSASLPRQATNERRLLLTEHPITLPQTKLFIRPRGRLWDIGTHRYFQVAVTTMDASSVSPSTRGVSAP